MISFAKAKLHYKENGYSDEELYGIILLCLEDGFVYNDGECFLCARPVFSKEVNALIELGGVPEDRKANFELDKCDTWFVYIASGNMKKAFDVIPELDFVAFERFDNNYRIYEFNRMRRLFNG